MRLPGLSFFITLLLAFCAALASRTLKVTADDILPTDQEVNDALQSVPDISGKTTHEIIKTLMLYYITQGLNTVSPTALDTFDKLQELEEQYNLVNNPLYRDMRQIDALAQVFVVAINGFSDKEEGVQKIAIDIVGKALGDKDDEKIVGAFTAAVAINFGCDQAIVAWNSAFNDVSATAAIQLNVDCEWDFTDPDEVLISPHPCPNDLARPCCKANPKQACVNKGYMYDVPSKQLYRNGELTCNCHG